MADKALQQPNTTTSTPSQPTSSASASPSPEPAKRNPALRALGLPSLKLRLPSRNWLIFLTITTSFTATLLYDRREKRRVQRKWADLVSHTSLEPLPPDVLPRRVTVFLAAPPGDGLYPAREQFKEYVKPVLVAGGVDWDVIEGRREGEVRRGLAERVRRLRRKEGGGMEELRARIGVKGFDGVGGDLVVGRNAWKEYVRGLHEGWLGPLEAPPDDGGGENAKRETPVKHEQQHRRQREDDVPATPDPELLTTPQADPLTEKGANDPPDDASPQVTAPPPQEEKKEEQPRLPKPLVPPAHNTPASYPSSALPPTIPEQFHPSQPIPFPHILGFLNFPTRIYRFLTRRYLADEIGRQTAAIVLANHRPYERPDAPADESGAGPPSSESEWEQQRLLAGEEAEWHKTAFRKEGDDPAREREWSDGMVVDRRLGRRMRRFELSREDEERAWRIGSGAAGIPGRSEGDGEKGP